MPKSYKHALLAIWILLIIILSLADYGSMPGAAKTIILFKRGYAAHFGAYFFASFLVWISFSTIQTMRYSLNSLILFLGVGLEFVQKYISYRTFNKVDMIMNLSGIICFNMVVFCFCMTKKNGGANNDQPQ